MGKLVNVGVKYYGRTLGSELESVKKILNFIRMILVLLMILIH